MATLTPVPKIQFFDINGDPLVGGKLYSYAAGTTTPLATFTDQGGGTPNANPVILDSRGEANVWLGSSSYKLRLTTAADVDIWTVDNIVNTTSLLSATAGTAAAPAIAWASQLNAGVYFGTNTVNISTGGTERVRVTNSGTGFNLSGATISHGMQVGVPGTASQFVFRSPSGVGALGNLLMDCQDSSLSGPVPFSIRGTEIYFGSGSGVTFTQQAMIDSSGRAGFGASLFPTERVHVDGNLRVSGTGPGSVILANSSNNSTWNLLNSGTTGTAQFDISQNGTATSRLRITNTGQVDIRAGSGSLLMNGTVTRYASSATLVNATTLAFDFAHGNSRKPDIARATLQRTSLAGNATENSYATGDEVDMTYFYQPGVAIGNVWSSSTRVGYALSGLPTVASKTALLSAQISSTGTWNILLYCIWL
jgi:hypothetical protein